MIPENRIDDFIGTLIACFEDFLCNHGIRLDNKIYEVGSDEAIIYGKMYDEIAETLHDMCDAWGIFRLGSFNLPQW